MTVFDECRTRRGITENNDMRLGLSQQCELHVLLITLPNDNRLFIMRVRVSLARFLSVFFLCSGR